MVQGGTQLDIFDALSMDTDSQQILGLIKRRVGRPNAISVEEISLSSGVSPRVVRDIVKGLIERHHIRIGSALGRPSGYYMIATQEEADANEATLRHLAISILTRAAVLKKLTIRDDLKEVQGELF
jgi:hypothetical protein